MTEIQNASKLASFTKAIVFAVLLATGLFATTGTAAASVGSPNQECQAAFGPGYTGFKIDNVNENQLNGVYTDPGTGFSVTISNTDVTQHTFDYTSSWPANVIVKGGPDQGQLYPSSDNGTGLHPPVNPNNGQYYGISHITFCWQPPADDESTLKITKIADNPVVLNGNSVVFTITVKNYGPDTAENVVVSDLVPDGLTVNSADSPCTVAAQLVTCVAGSLPANETRTYKIYTTADPILPVDSPDDQLDISKVEQQISLQPGESRVVQITCGPNGFMTDASVRVDHVDQGTGNLDSVEVHRLHSIDASTYQTEVTNHATGQAQVKLFGVCLGKKTTSGHDLSVGPLIHETFSLDAGTHTRELTCGPGTTPIAPGFAVSGGRTWLIASAPVGSQTRKFTFKVDQDDTIATISMRCISNLTSNGGQLQWAPISKTIQIAPGATVSEQLTCGVGYKGVVAGWEYDHKLVPLGNDPQPITRVFKIWNPTGETLNATLHLLCLKLRTGTPDFSSKDYVNTAYVSSSTPQGPGAILSDDATVTVTGNSVIIPPAPGPGPDLNENHSSGDIEIFSAKFSGQSIVVTFGAAGKAGRILVNSPRRLNLGQRTIKKGSLIGSGRFSAGAKTTTKVKLSKKAVKAVKAGKLKRVRISVLAGGKSKNRLVSIK